MSQVNFFMLSRDEEAFVGYLESRGDTLALQESDRRVPIQEALATNHRLITLVHRELKTQAEGARLFQSPFIDFSRSSLEQSVLVSGRLYAKLGWLSSPADNKLFLSWYRSIERWLKTNYSKQEGWWVAPQAAEWSRAGGLLALGHRNAKTISLAAGV